MTWRDEEECRAKMGVIMKRAVAIFISLSLMAAVSSCGRAGRDAGTDDKDTGSASVEAGIESETDAEADMPDREGAGNAAEKEDESETAGKTEKGQTNLLGGLSPEDALEYMKTTENLVIVEVNTAQWKKETPFTGAMWIPHDEMAERYDEIPEGCPVILHCGAGVVSVPAYETLIEKRPDIPELSYIDGAPPIEEYNEWLESR